MTPSLDNIGFDVRGDVKIFDFGLSKLLPENIDDSCSLKNDIFMMTGQIGSLRYMAPEVVKSEYYNQLCDVYSFGILLFEMLTATLPYENMSISEHVLNVAIKGKRPSTSAVKPKIMATLINNCWQQIFRSRPSFRSISTTIGLEYNKIKNCSEFYDEGLSRSQHILFRSTHSIINVRT